jgi:hypothetical protein
LELAPGFAEFVRLETLVPFVPAADAAANRFVPFSTAVVEGAEFVSFTFVSRCGTKLVSVFASSLCAAEFVSAATGTGGEAEFVPATAAGGAALVAAEIRLVPLTATGLDTTRFVPRPPPGGLFVAAASAGSAGTDTP